MNPERWQKIESIFQKALDADSSHRASVLEDSCAGDESLRVEVESLLAQYENAGEFIERPAFAGPIDTSLHNIAIQGLAPDGSAALVGTGHFEVYTPPLGPLWSIPLPAGEPRRLGNFEVMGGAGYFPNGHLVFIHESDLFIADADGANPRKFASAGSDVYFPSVSPDGRQIVLTNGPSADALSLVKVGSDGKGMRTLYDGHSACCSVWTPDGKYLLYHDIGGDKRQDVWAIPMGETLFRRSSLPIQLTAGPLSYSGLSVSRDGKQVFAIGTTDRALNSNAIGRAALPS